jgi:hypothetical protein
VRIPAGSVDLEAILWIVVGMVWEGHGFSHAAHAARNADFALLHESFTPKEAAVGSDSCG